MVRVDVSQRRLEGLQYFDKVDMRPEPTEVSSHKNLIVGVEEKNTGNLTMGAGFSSVDSIVGFVEVSQGNFDLFHPPNFTGGGQKFRHCVSNSERNARTTKWNSPSHGFSEGNFSSVSTCIAMISPSKAWRTFTPRFKPAAASG